jgi:hypothetical protein
MLYKIKTSIRRFLNRLFKTQRPSSYPFLTGDGFRSIAQFQYDQFFDFNPKSVSKGDIVCVRNNCLKEYFNNVHPLINEPYVLISNNEDSSVDSSYIKSIDEKIIHWYAQNLTFKNPKVSLLPIGVQNFTVGPDEDFIHSFKEEDINVSKKLARILFGFAQANEERKELFNILSKYPLADHISKPRSEYYKTLNEYKFIASPRGAGIDCHRTWEAFHYKVIPILIRNDFSEQIEFLGFPVMLVDTWAEILQLTEQDLESFYEAQKNKFERPELFLPYWYTLFISHR